MNQMLLHIEFLLHEHNCVIVPQLGGFVVNTTPVKKDGLSGFHAPVCELVFNRDLTYNDGLLIESYMRTEKISFESAQLKIKAAVKEIKEILRDEKTVSLGGLGSFKMMDDEHFSYLPKPFTRPEYYGLSLASLKPIIQLQPKTISVQKEESEPKTIWKNVGIGAAVAAVFLLVFFLFPVQDSTIGHQTAQIITESGLFGSKADKPNTGAAVAETTIAANVGNENNIEVAPDPSVSEAALIVEADDSPRYYIVTGVYEVRNYADKMIAQLKEEGFLNPITFEKSGRITICSDSHSTIEEAYNALNKLIKQNQRHRNAWVLKR